MTESLKSHSCEIELRPGEKLVLPPTLTESVGVGRWIITVQPADEAERPIRSHSAFLNGYAVEDEGLYDDDTGR
jgi:hypothetical protein